MSDLRQSPTLKKRHLIWMIAAIGIIGVLSILLERPSSEPDLRSDQASAIVEKRSGQVSAPDSVESKAERMPTLKRVTAILPLVSNAPETPPDERVELEEEAAAIERYTSFQVQRLSNKLRLEPEQEDRLFALIASRSPSFDSRMQLMAGGKPISIARMSTAGSVTRTRSGGQRNSQATASGEDRMERVEVEIEQQTSLEDEIAEQLTAEQREAFTKSRAEDEEWWGDVITKLRVNAGLSRAGVSAADGFSDGREVEDPSDSDPATSKTGSSGGRRNTLSEE